MNPEIEAKIVSHLEDLATNVSTIVIVGQDVTAQILAHLVKIDAILYSIADTLTLLEEKE